jgi:hypothetical protein
MAVLVISLIVGFAAMAVLLGCLKGFSQSLKHKKLSGLLVDVEGPGRPALLRESETLVDIPPRKSGPAQDPATRRISNGTVALVGLAILLGSRGVTSETRAATVKPRHDPKLQRGEKAQVPGVQPLHSS